MTKFWVIVARLMYASIASIDIIGYSGGYQTTLAERGGLYVATAILVAVIWAILFRPQVEHLRISLKSLLALVLLEAILLAVIRIAKPFWAM
jgi:hypothetical protein